MPKLLLFVLVIIVSLSAPAYPQSTRQHSGSSSSAKTNTTEVPFTNAISALVVVAVLFAIGYGIYSKILKQMAINAKNKRLIKNQVTYWTGREYRRSKRN